jgi:lipopolysaccharide/colanic/teichoic acid biosynthesis glycosyltransferase
MLVLLSPLLGLIALAIRLDSPGPVLFRQPRLGFNNRLFTCYKFRTMHHRMTDLLGDQQATRGDPRITRIGKWLRTVSPDELPQIINALKGDMPIVGPRPHPRIPKRRTSYLAMWWQSMRSVIASSPVSLDGPWTQVFDRF